MRSPLLSTGFAVAVAAAALVGVPLGPAPAATATAPPPSSVARCTVQSGTYTNFGTPTGPRKLKIVVPAGATAKTPMIVSMHGASGSSESQEAVTGFTKIAHRDGVIVVYPQATGNAPMTVWHAQPGSADIKYVAQATTFMQSRGCSSPTRTFINGYSMGAMMTSRLMCSNSNLYAGAAMVAGVLPPTPGCTLPSPKTIVIVHGTADLVVPYDGTMPVGMLQNVLGGPRLSNYPGVTRAGMAALWAKTQRCTAAAQRATLAPGTFRDDYLCGRSATRALVHPGGHWWNPNGFNTSEYLWAQFRAALPPAP